MTETMSGGDPINILLAEDDEDDTEIILLAFQEAGVKNNLYIVRNGQEVLDYLDRKDPYQDTKKYPLPQLIFLDINMPRVSGIDALKKLKGDPRHKAIPVIMLTSSKHEADIAESYNYGAAAYIVKSINHKEFIETIRCFNSFWQRVELPKRIS